MIGQSNRNASHRELRIGVSVAAAFGEGASVNRLGEACAALAEDVFPRVKGL